jgi:uncharacterized protein
MEYLLEGLILPLKSSENNLKKILFKITESIKKNISDKSIEIQSLKIVKKSIDARKKNNIKIVISLKLSTSSKISKEDMHNLKIKPYLYNKETFTDQKINRKKNMNQPVIVGFGPAGIFCALKLVELGYVPLIFERGKAVEERVLDVSEFWNRGDLNEESNVAFGEGGAGTFSDGKLSTQINNPLIKQIKEALVRFGAPSEILYEAKPHIGTDKLRIVLRNIREHLISKGVEINFSSKLTDIVVHDSKIKEIVINDKSSILLDKLFLCIGHSAHDTYHLLYEKGVLLEPKPFAIGFRVEHPQILINQIQFGEKYKSHPLLSSASYKLTYRTATGRNIFSFCMCPGGKVICASNQQGRLVVNGMSDFERDSSYANSAVVIGISVADYYQDSVLDGLSFIEKYERKAFELGGKSFSAPAQKLVDYFDSKITNQIPSSLYKPTVTPANLNEIFSENINQEFKEAFRAFNNKMKGFVSEDALLIGVETRTSSPIRIPRKENYEHVEIKGLYPIGEGAGYSGGIISSALDGLKVASVSY